MAADHEYRYVPESVLPPGATIAEILEDRGITQGDFALLLGRTEKNVSQLVNGKAPVNHDTALELERVLGVPASFWNNAEARYRDSLARQREDAVLAGEAEWANRFPLKAMADHDWIARESSPSEQAAEVLRFFGTASPQAWEDYWASPKRLAARMTAAYTVDIPSLTAWLRQGELMAQTVHTAPYDARRFGEVVVDARTMTRAPVDQAFAALRESCASAGVALVPVPELPNIRCSGVSRWLGPSKALIQLCLRYKSADQLWFSFFHEAAHILKHDHRRTYVQGLGAGSTEELEADQFASDLLIPRAAYKTLLADKPLSSKKVGAFADEIGVAPGIVVGRLQHDGAVPFGHMNGLKVKVDWGEYA